MHGPSGLHIGLQIISSANTKVKSEHRLVWMDESLLAHLARQLVFSRKHQPYSTINKGLVEDYIHPGAKWVFVGIPQLSS